MNKAIEKAIEGGWKDYQVLDTNRFASQIPQVMFLDPLFWQALARNLNGGILPRQKRWVLTWKEFISHLASGGDAEEFFNQLLK